MEEEASQQLGEPVRAGALLSKAGQAKALGRKTSGSMFGLVGILGSRALDKRDAKKPVEIINEYHDNAYLAVTATRAVLFSIEMGKLKQKLGTPVKEFAPGDLDRIEFGKSQPGVTSVDIITSDMLHYQFETSKVFLKRIRQVADAIGVRVVED